MPYWVVSGNSLWGWVPLWLRTRQPACTASCPVSGGQQCGHLGLDNRDPAETAKSWGGEGGEQNGHIQVRAFSQAGGLRG